MIRKAIQVMLFLLLTLSVLNSNAQTLTWSGSYSDYYTTNVTGQGNGQPGFGSAMFQNQIWIAYLDKRNCTNDASGATNCYIVVSSNGQGAPMKSDTYNGLAFSWQTNVYISTPLVSNANPALATNADGTKMYLAYTGPNNTNMITYTSDGSNWSVPESINFGTQNISNVETWWSPTIAASPYDDTVYLGYMNGNTKQMIFCQYVSTGNYSCAQRKDLSQVTYNPAIGFYNGSMYIAYTTLSGNCVNVTYAGRMDFISTGTPVFYPALSGCTQTSNAAPSLAVYNNNLYAIYRKNNNSKNVMITASSNGTSFSTPQQLSFGMAGPPNALAVNYSASGTTPTAPFLVDFYFYNNQLYYTFGK